MSGAPAERDPRTNEQRYFDALKEIATAYDTDRLRKNAEKRYGLSGDEAIEYAHDNLREVAIMAIHGKRRPTAEIIRRGDAGEKK